MQNGGLFEATVRRMLLTGSSTLGLTLCSSGDTNGECNSFVSGNADEGLSETGADCLFSLAGGAFIPPRMPPAAWSDPMIEAITYFMEMPEAGTAAGYPAVTMATAFIAREVCNAITARLGLADADTHVLDPELQTQCYEFGGFYAYAHIVRL